MIWVLDCAFARGDDALPVVRIGEMLHSLLIFL
jgi:hypothetical protein